MTPFGQNALFQGNENSANGAEFSPISVLSGATRSAGNGQFDLNAIATQAQALADRLNERRLLAEQAIADEIEETFTEALSGSDSDPASLAEQASLAMRLGVAGIAATAQGAITRIQEVATRKRGGEDETFDPRDQRSRKDKDKEEELSDFRSNVRQMLRMRAEEQDRIRAERERETIGGVEMSRADWGRLAAAIQNDERSRSWFIQHFMDQGLSREEAERRTKIIQEAAAAAAKKPEDRTPADLAAMRRADETPGVGGAVSA